MEGYQEIRGHRPLGIIIISILDIIFGIIATLSGIALIILRSLIQYFPFNELHNMNLNHQMINLIELLGGVLGTVLLIFGFIGILVGYFLWKGREFARILHIVLSLLGVLSGILSMYGNIISGVLSVIFNIILIYYLTRFHVKAFFKS